MAWHRACWGVVAVSPVLVGRAAEVAVLGESWALARGGSPATVLIGGEAGIGKTRLVRQFTAGVEAEVLYGGCVDLSGGGLPFGPFTAALRGHADTPAELLPRDGQADSDTARARLFEEVLTRFAGTGAQVAAAGAPGLLDGLGRRAAETPATGPVLRALALTFAAEADRAAGTVARTPWDEAVAAWDGVGNPYQLAHALIGAAEAAAADGDRPAAAAQVRRAAQIADRLGARPLREQAESLARRARLALAGDPAAPAAGPGDQARRQYGLTARELEVLRLVAAGRSNRDIAAELFISAKTASVHVSNIMSKLGVASCVEAAALACRLGLADQARPT